MAMTDIIDHSEINFRVIDQRIGAGIGGYDTVIRLLHVPTGLIVEVPRVTNSQHSDREIAMQMLEAALTHPKIEKWKFDE
jgi:protein subunit release factor A